MPKGAAAIEDAVTASPLVVARMMDKGAILMNTSSGDCFELNSVGATVWDLIGRGVGLAGILEKIVDTYAVEPETARTDLLLLVGDLARQGIVNVAKR